MFLQRLLLSAALETYAAPFWGFTDIPVSSRCHWQGRCGGGMKWERVGPRGGHAISAHTPWVWQKLISSGQEARRHLILCAVVASFLPQDTSQVTLHGHLLYKLFLRHKHLLASDRVPGQRQGKDAPSEVNRWVELRLFYRCMGKRSLTRAWAAYRRLPDEGNVSPAYQLLAVYTSWGKAWPP